MAHGDFLTDPTTWYCLALIIFLVIVVRFARKPAAGWLDVEIARIKADLDEAARLRSEAAALVEQYQARQKTALMEAERIVSHAKRDAEALREDAEKELARTIQRREKQALDRIAVTEAEAVQAIRMAIVEQAVAAVQSSLAAQLARTSQDAHIEAAIRAVGGLVDGKRNIG